MPGKDAIQMLKEDHKEVKGLLEQLTKAQGGERRSELLDDIKQGLTVHSMLEEELFYPAFEKEADTKESRVKVLESLDEHGLVDQVLAELEELEPDSEEFDAKATVLKELVEHHIEDEEKEMLPKAQKVMSQKRLDALSEDMAARKEEIEANYEEEIEAR